MLPCNIRDPLVVCQGLYLAAAIHELTSRYREKVSGIESSEFFGQLNEPTFEIPRRFFLIESLRDLSRQVTDVSNHQFSGANQFTWSPASQVASAILPTI